MEIATAKNGNGFSVDRYCLFLYTFEAEVVAMNAIVYKVLVTVAESEMELNS